MKKVDMTRGKPSEEQLDLVMEMENPTNGIDPVYEGIDVRNYGQLDGLRGARELLSEILQTQPEHAIAFGNSSLTLMFLYARWLLDLYRSDTGRNDAKFLALTPGYDRHFNICQELGIKMLSVPLLESGPNIEAVKNLIANDASIIGMWCVPKYSNPSGIVYSDDAVKACAGLPQSGGKHFTVFWDNAYGVHDFDPDSAPSLLPLMKEAQSIGTENNVAIFGSTSKITFAGSGIAGIGLSAERRAQFLKHMGSISIGPDKVVQLKHIRFFEKNGLKNHMRKHSSILAPKFNAVEKCFSTMLKNISGVSWSETQGGYFISLYLPKGAAKKVCATALQKGVTLTAAGSAYPYGLDPDDAHLRIAPSYPVLEDVEYAAKVIADSVIEVVNGLS